MESEKRAILATTTYARSTDNYERIRARLALKTIFEARLQDYDIVVVDGGSPDDFIYNLLDLEAKVFQQEVPGMGNARRQALRLAKEASSNGDAVVWLEPEKYTLIPFIKSGTEKITSENYDLVMFRRANLDSYPPEQVHAYQMVQLAFRYLTNIDCDFLFGPVALSHRATDYFLAYRSEYGDMWDSIHIPKFHIMREGLPWTQVTINYQHPQEQTRAEQGNMDLFMRRVEQVRVVTQALICEVTQHRQHETTHS